MSQTCHYSTLAVTAPLRFDYWKDVVCHHCLDADSKLLAQSDFDGVLEVHSMGALDICTLSAPLHYWERSAQHLRSDPNDDLWLGFTRSGYGELEQADRRTKLTADDLFLYDASQPFRFSFGGTDNHLVRIPRQLLSQRLPSIADCTAVVLDDRRPGVIPLREMLRQAASMPSGFHNTGVSSRYSSTLLDLLVVSLELQDLKQTHDELDLHGRIMNYIHRYLSEADLSLERIAQAHHVSTRTVTRAFARHQKSPVAEIWKARLLASRDAIERGQVRSISQAALDFGFSDFSHFSHAFRKAFGVAPHTLLRRE
ncbi:DNA-binding domain-containing protein, AraC-type [Pseudomonas sp. GM50]|uniref:AraC-like ligand-binding domain-containing protein n=1 Tax=Pseudomonas sp. GM50 TaxID=1144332 RepID=UPI0002706015|nr:helix-turn-helix domain-containing protein [Pseudomonas sp. GM50]EJM70080.1 DNA-binding domain-containing protein, AraC-type [Pseudomonas sp. GM50]